VDSSTFSKKKSSEIYFHFDQVKPYAQIYGELKQELHSYLVSTLKPDEVRKLYETIFIDPQGRSHKELE